MSIRPRLVLALTLLASAFPALADSRATADSTDRSTRATAAQAKQQTMRHSRDGAKSTQAVAATRPGQPLVNVVRAYPPSCLADPLPDTPSGPLYRNQNVALAATDGAGGYYTENVTVTIWRVACSSATLFNSATLMRIDRRPEYNGDADVYPLFPGIEVAQGTVGFGNPAGLSFARIANEPNTIVSDTVVDSPIVYSTTYVLENYPFDNAGYFDFNLPFSVRLDNFFNTNRYSFINNVPSYNPTAATYPDAYANLPLSGYIGSNWYDPAHSGEGMIVRINENEARPDVLSLEIAWYTYDANGTPFWLYGGADFPRGAREVTSPMIYQYDGYFAGNGPTGPAARGNWGQVIVSFPSCRDMRFTYTALAGLPDFVPRGTGTRNLKSISNQNGLFCE
ncbi:hypothetical protein ACQQ2N_07695 [Dokdonella sp. MW10]|uniref:hypothetical protein n=1 Tax=Dokdonella sp. MW10 TaxID=2992926 RepID=UPI003F7CF149